MPAKESAFEARPLSPRAVGRTKDDSSATKEERLKTLETLAEYATTLLTAPIVAVRELKVLRKAFAVATKGFGAAELVLPVVTKADSVLKALEALADKAGADALTGDEARNISKDARSLRAQGVLGVPIRRRLQSAMLAPLLFFTGPPICYLVLALLLWWTWTRPLAIAYVMYIIFSKPRHPLKRRQWYMQLPIWRLWRDYFPIRLYVPEKVRNKIRPKENHYMVCVHPHGVHSFATVVNFTSEANDLSKQLNGIKIHSQTLGINFKIPFWRELSILAGSGDASKGAIMKTLTSKTPGDSVLLVVGGAEESLLATPGTSDLVLAKRKGFVKLALVAGAPIIPVFTFGENDVYENLASDVPAIASFQRWAQKKLGFALVMINGRSLFNYSWGILPHRRPMVSVVGEPVVVPKVENPTDADVDKWHAAYIAGLGELYAEYADIFEVDASARARIVA